MPECLGSSSGSSTAHCSFLLMRTLAHTCETYGEVPTSGSGLAPLEPYGHLESEPGDRSALSLNKDFYPFRTYTLFDLSKGQEKLQITIMKCTCTDAT